MTCSEETLELVDSFYDLGYEISSGNLCSSSKEASVRIG